MCSYASFKSFSCSFKPPFFTDCVPVFLHPSSLSFFFLYLFSFSIFFLPLFRFLSLTLSFSRSLYLSRYLSLSLSLSLALSLSFIRFSIEFYLLSFLCISYINQFVSFLTKVNNYLFSISTVRILEFSKYNNRLEFRRKSWLHHRVPRSKKVKKL